MSRRGFIGLGAAVCLVMCSAPAYAQDEGARQEEGSVTADLPSEYQWIFGESVKPAPGPAQPEPSLPSSTRNTRRVPRPKDRDEQSEETEAEAEASGHDSAVEEEAYADSGSSIDPFTWDFGNVEAGRVLEHEFVIDNKSKTPMKITSVNTSCGCTVSEVQKMLLQPGEQTAISVRFKTKGYHGAVKQSIFVHTDNPQQPVIRYIVQANIVQPGGE